MPITNTGTSKKTAKTYNPKLKFRYDINALRAIAVIGVILYHYHVPFFSGGFSGVDVFFVISGYLMSKIIITSINEGDFSVLDFYGKRIKRIIPALLFLIVVLIAFCFFFYFPFDYQQIGKYATASIFFISNIYYWRITDYFAEAARTNMFLHTWSLSVEWQFYLLYPLILLLLNKYLKERRKMIWMFALSIFLIFLVSIFVTKYKAIASFYLLPTRSWEMLFGGLAFYMEDIVKGRTIKKLTAILGYSVILLTVVFLNDQMAWPGIFTFIPAAATFFIIISNVNNFSVLSSGITQFFGKISYSLYLWHWPIFVIAGYFGLAKNYTSIVSLILLSIAIAYCSYRYVEMFKVRVKTIMVATACLGVVTIIVAFGNINGKLFKKTTIELSDYKLHHLKETKSQFSEGGCFIIAPAPVSDFNKGGCLFLDPNRKNILILGDSHAAQFFKSLSEAFTRRNINLIRAAASDCLPIIKTHGAPACVDLINYIYKDFIVHNSKKIDGVIISAQWLAGGRPEVLTEDLKTTIAYLERLHVKIVILGQNKTFSIPYPVVAAKEYEYNLHLEDNFIDDRSLKINQFLKQQLGSYYIDIYHFNYPTKVSQNIPYMVDENHFTKWAADTTVKLVLANKQMESFLNPQGLKSNVGKVKSLTK